MVSKYRPYITICPEPWRKIDQIQKLQSSGVKFGRHNISAGGKTKKEVVVESKPTDDKYKDDGSPVDRVYVHGLYSIESGSGKYDTMSKIKNMSGKIRIYKDSFGDDGFRDTTVYERPAYMDILQAQINKLISSYKDYRYYGTYDSSGVFRIHVKSDAKDSRKNKGGKTATTWSISELCELIFVENISDPRIDSMVIESATRVEMINLLKTNKHRPNWVKNWDNYSDAEILFLSRIYKYGTKKEQLIDVVTIFMQENQRVVSL